MNLLPALTKKYPKISALLAALAVAGGLYYGVSPTITKGVLCAGANVSCPQ